MFPFNYFNFHCLNGITSHTDTEIWKVVNAKGLNSILTLSVTGNQISKLLPKNQNLEEKVNKLRLFTFSLYLVRRLTVFPAEKDKVCVWPLELDWKSNQTFLSLIFSEACARVSFIIRKYFECT